MVIGGDVGMGKTELTEYTVTEAVSRFNFMPVFGTACSRPGEKYRPMHELLRSVVLAFRHLDAALPAQEKSALISLIHTCDRHTSEIIDFAQELREDLGLPDGKGEGTSTHEAVSEAELRFCKKGIELVGLLVRQLTKQRAVLCNVSLRSGSNIFESKERSEDEEMFWELVSELCDIVREDSENPLLLMVVMKGTLDDVPSDLRRSVHREGFLKLMPLQDDTILEYMATELMLATSKVPESLHRFVAKITQGNALFIRETIEQLLHYGHVTMVTGSNGVHESMKCETEFEDIDIAIWTSTSMVGGTICLLESLDPLQAAVVKMATVFHGVFTVSDLAASSCSRWAGATYFDAVRVFYSLSMLVDRGIIDRADDGVDKAFLGNDEHVIDCFRLNNVLVRKVGNSMVLEAQKKAVKRQALMDRVLAKELPQKMIELRRKKAIVHIPWYYQIDQAEGKARAGNM